MAAVWFLDYQRRLELIHDLRFETATTRIKATPDGQYVIASGMQVLVALYLVLVMLYLYPERDAHL